MTSATPWNPTEVSMLQATHQGGSTYPWKRQIETVDSSHEQFEYADFGNLDDAYMDAIDPSLVHLSERLNQHQSRINAQVDTVYELADTPGRRTFVSDERHQKVTAEMIAEKFGISIP